MLTSLLSQLAPSLRGGGHENRPGEDAIIAPHLYPGEEVLYRIRGVERPLWPLWALALLAFAFLFRRRYLVVATERRLLLIAHETRFGRAAGESIASVPWGELERVELGGGSLFRTLRISAHDGRWRRTIRVRPTFAAHEGIVAVFRRKKRVSQASRRA